MSSGPLSFRAVLFDLDGTLVDSGDDIVSAANVALAAVGRPALPGAVVRGYVGDGLPNLLRRCLGEDTSRLDEALAAWRAWYGEHALDTTRLYPGVARLIERLAPVPLAVVSNKPEAFCRRMLEGLELDGAIDAVLGGDSLPLKKPDPGPCLEAARRLGVAPEACLMVGDGPQDLRAGRAAGMITIGCAWGFRPRDELEAVEPDHLVDEVSGLAALLLGD